MKRFFSYTTIWILSLFALGQNFNPSADRIFREDEVLEIRINMLSSDFDFLHAEENRGSETYVPAEVTFNNSELINQTITNVGVRLRGNTSRGHDKRSYKIDFREYGGPQFEGNKKINLKPNVNDPTVVRELLSMHLFRIMNVPAPLVAPAVLYINDDFRGTYLAVEQIDDEFIDKRFGKEVGYLYKCAYSATLENNDRIFDDQLYESKMNEETDDKSHLKHFVEVLNDTPDENFKEEIEKVFDVDRFLRYLAVEAIIGHWDGYSYLNNNYYFYFDEDDGGIFQFIAYDADNTWGIDWIGRDWANRSLISFSRTGKPRPLTNRILQVREYKSLYLGYLRFLFNNFFTEEYLYPIFDNLELLLEDHVKQDELFSNSFGFTYQSFSEGFQHASEGHVAYGLRSFVEERRASGIPTLPDMTLSTPLESNVIYPNPSTDGIFTIECEKLNTDKVSAWSIAGRELTMRILSSSRGILQIQIDGYRGPFILHDGTYYTVLLIK